MASPVLSLVYGATTLTLSSGSYLISAYTPRNDGEGVDYVSESAEIMVVATSTALVQTAVNDIIKAFRQADIYQNQRYGSPVYVTLTPEGYATAIRSRLISGSCDPTPGIFDPNWGKFRALITVSWLRQNFWEDENPTTATLWNNSGSWTITGSASNAYDATRDNWARVVTTVGGDLPADVSLTIKNTNATDSTTAYVEDVYVACGNLDATQFSYEGEYAVSVGTGATVTGSGLASCSNSSYVNWSWSGTAEYNPMYWSVPSGSATAYAGKYYNLFMRFTEAPSADCDAKFRLSYAVGTATAGETAWVPLSSTKCLQYIATMKIPPYPLTDTAAALNLELWLRSSTSGTHTMKLDFIGVMPTEAGFRRLIPMNSGYSLVWLNRYITDDGFTEALTSYNAAAQSFVSHTGKGKLQLIPGQTNTLYVLHSKSDQTALPSRTLNIVLSFRAKRRLL